MARGVTTGRNPGKPLIEEPRVRLVNLIYEGAVDPRAWPGIVQTVAAYVGAPMGRLFTPFVEPERGPFDIAAGIPEPAVRQWRAQYAGHDLWAQAAVARDCFREGRVLTDSDLVPEGEFARSVIYREHLAQLGIGRMCSGIVFDRRSPAVLPTQFSAFRELAAQRFGDEERRRMRWVLPHLSRALGVLYRLRDAEQKVAASLAALDRLATGVMLLDAAGAVAHLNREAERIVAEADGLALGPDGGGEARLAVQDAGAQEALRTVLESVLNPALGDAKHFCASVEVRRPSGRPPFVLQLAPLPEEAGFAGRAGPAVAIVFVTDPAAPHRFDPKLLRQVYGVTPAEARLAERLHAGDTLAAAAARRGIGEETARTQLRGLFAKTGTHRQSDLMRLLISLASPGPAKPPPQAPREPDPPGG